MKSSKKSYLTLKGWLPILRKAAGEGGRVLSAAGLRRASGLSEATLRKALQRLEGAGIVFRVGPGLYAGGMIPPSLEELSMVLGRPCYVSFESALSRHGILSQSPMMLTCATRRKPRLLETKVGEIALRHISRRLFWGFREESGILWAEPEKALLDWLYWKRKTEGRAPDTDELALEDIDRGKLARWARDYPSSVRKALRAALGPSSEDAALEELIDARRRKKGASIPHAELKRRLGLE